MRLLQEIGRRLADGLTSRFVLHSLRASEGRLAEAQRVAHVGHWDRDLVTGRVTLSPESMRIFGISFRSSAISPAADDAVARARAPRRSAARGGRHGRSAAGRRRATTSSTG